MRTYLLTYVSKAAFAEVKTASINDSKPIPAGMVPSAALIMDGVALLDDEESVQWRMVDRNSGDPVWKARLGDLLLTVFVECEWTWRWMVSREYEELAAGDVDAAGQAEVDLGAWDYQNVQWAQQRCEAVARALAPMLAKPTAEGKTR